ncbi:MAG: hypothetical protein J0626_08365, partial [Rhodospirillaceae bacterium]|nr:hypothetical protein [Rhodospirillaceae bacterium]
MGTNDGVFDYNLLTDDVYVTRVPEVPSATAATAWIHPDDRAMNAEATRAAIEDGVPYDVEYRSQSDGVMHACGHDGHTSIALGL